MNTNENGRKWARTFLLIALGVSVIGNITHTVMQESSISLWLRVPGAVVWPLFTWGAIEIVVRVIWEKRGTHHLARTAVLFPAVPAAITSYEHLYNLLGMMGERALIQWIGPAAIDGLMIGCTLTLLFTRQAIEEVVPVAQKSHSLNTIFSQDEGTGEPRGIVNDPKIETSVKPMSTPAVITREMLQDAPDFAASVAAAAPVSPAPRRPRAPRTTWDATKVVDMLLEGSDRGEIMAATQVPQASFYRLQRVVRMLTADRNAAIDSSAEKVSPEIVKYVREAVAR